MIRFDDYTKPDGRIDWSAYYAAQRAAGDICRTCSAHIITLDLFSKRTPGPRECYACIELRTSSSRVEHDHRLRCPKCEHVWPVTCDESTYRLYEDGEHETCCPQCEHAFTISTRVEYHFTSPKLVNDKENV